METCIKVIGADFELANAVETPGIRSHVRKDAAKLLLDQIHGFPRHRSWSGTMIEWGRRFLAENGGSAYIDSDHLEINLPEHTRAEDHAALMHAGFALARQAQVAASAALGDGERLNVMAAVSDGRQSWGHHLNVMVTRELFDAMFIRKPHLASFLATHLATAPIYAGQGHVGAANQREACDYQLSQRADWFEELIGPQTTHRRPLLNVRDEPHAGPGLARMHIIYFDNVLSPIANYLKAGTTQLVLAMAEAGWADPALLLDDPLDACAEVSRDLTLKQPLQLAQRGRQAAAVQVQKSLADLAGEFVASGEAKENVPGAEQIIAAWQQTLALLAERDLTALARRCDWALKYLLLDRQRGRRGLTWQSPEMRCLDLRYASLDPSEGLFWRMAAAGLVEEMPKSERVERFEREPPDDTRAYLRAHVLRRFGESIVDLDWDRVRFAQQNDRPWSWQATLMMPDPSDFGRVVSEPILERCTTLAQLIEAVGSDVPSPRNDGGWRPSSWSAPSSRFVGYSRWPNSYYQ
ncbi:MAG: proteasome accessory factor PafA2 family protein [Gemmataceae bacterium]|nr:proteasome accessory factor PafA2 family protein [Gemmataceae bacterium]